MYVVESTVMSDAQSVLTHWRLETPKRVTANSADLDQTPQNAASDQGLHCLQIVQQFSVGLYLYRIVWHT